MRSIDPASILQIGDDRLRRLRERLRAIAFDSAFAARLARPGDRLDDALRAPIRIWHARRISEPAAVAARLFLLHDAVERGEAERSIGDLAPYLACGMLVETAQGLTAGVHVGFAGDALVFGDAPGAGPDAVPPLGGGSLALLSAASPARPVQAALDLGCGAGAVSLVLARTSGRVLATDVSPRAIAFARLNARFNGANNIEFRQGHLVEPARGERFELLACQPPFVAHRAGVPLSVYVHGGRRGDELALDVLRDAPDLLAPAGRAVLLADLPIADGDSIEQRVRGAVDSGAVELLALIAPAKSLDEYCTFHAAAEHPMLGDAFSQAVIEQRDHLDGLGVRGVALTIVVLQKTASCAFKSALAVRHSGDVPVTAAAIDRILDAHRLAHGNPGALLAARLRVPAGARVIRQPATDGTSGGSTIVHPPAGRPEWPAVFDESIAALIDGVGRAATVGEAARVVAEERSLSGPQAIALVKDAAREGLLRGALDVG